MQIVPSGGNLHEILKPVLGKNEKSIIKLSSTGFAKRVIKVIFSEKTVSDISNESSPMETSVVKKLRKLLEICSVLILIYAY